VSLPGRTTASPTLPDAMSFARSRTSGRSSRFAEHSNPFERPASSGPRALRSPSARSRSGCLVRRGTRVEPALTGRAVASGAERQGTVAGLVAVEEGVGAGGSAARPPVSRPEPARARSWRVVGLGRRVVRGGRERGPQAVSDRNEHQRQNGAAAPERGCSRSRWISLVVRLFRGGRGLWTQP
jgi:hypothetical protein